MTLTETISLITMIFTVLRFAMAFDMYLQSKKEK